MSSNSLYTPLTYRIAFAAMQGMGVDLARKLLDVVGSEEQFFAMSEKELRALTRGRSKIYGDAFVRKLISAIQICSPYPALTLSYRFVA